MLNYVSRINRNVFLSIQFYIYQNVFSFVAALILLISVLRLFDVTIVFQYTLLTEIREFLLPEDRLRFDELVYRRGEEQFDHHIKVYFYGILLLAVDVHSSCRLFFYAGSEHFYLKCRTNALKLHKEHNFNSRT